MRTEPRGGGGAFWPLQLWATPPGASADSCPGPGFGDSPDGILDGPYLPSFIPPIFLPVKCELRPLDTNLQPEQGAHRDTRELQGQKHQPVSRSGSPGLGARHSLLSPRPLEAAFWTLTPGSFSCFGSSTSTPLAVAAQTACGSSRFLLEGAS